MSEAPAQPEEGVAIQKYLESSRLLLKRVREFDYRKLFQDLLTFLSIIVAYFVISLTYQFPRAFQPLLGIDLGRLETIPLLAFLFSLYLLFWNLVAYLMKKRALRPPPKKDEYEEVPAEEPQRPLELQPLPQGEKYVHEIIYASLDQTVYLFLLLVSIGAYSYLNQPQRQPLAKLVDVERVSYIGVWFLAGNLFCLLGELLEKATRMSEWKVLGLAMRYIVGFLSLGLANGYNTFIFI